jgi:RND family efflux transporter MFP subunit
MRPLMFILVMAALAACQPAAKPAPPPPPPREVDVLTMAPSILRDTQEYLGTLRSRQTARVAPQVTGYVRKIHVRPGQVVSEGAPLVDIDAREEVAALQSAQAARAAQHARLELAKQTRVRTEALQKAGLANAQEVDRARADEAAAQADARAADAQITQRKVQLQYNVVKAPVAGTVADVLVNLGDYVTPSSALTSIVGGGQLEVSVPVPAPRARQVTLSTPIELLDRDGKILLTTPVYFIAASADPLTQLVELKALVPAESGLRPGEVVRARVIYGVSKALQVPALSVVRQSGQPFVYVVSAGKDGGLVVTRKPITLGDLGAESYVVLDGLAAGDRIATSSIQALRDGARIVAKQPVAAAAAGTAP